MTHGGARSGAGRPRANIDDKRVMVLISQGVSRPAIALRFGVPLGVIQYSILKSKAQSTLTKGN